MHSACSGRARRPAAMPRGIKKHLKRINAPKHWMLDKLGGVFVRIPTALVLVTATRLAICSGASGD